MTELYDRAVTAALKTLKLGDSWADNKSTSGLFAPGIGALAQAYILASQAMEKRGSLD